MYKQFFHWFLIGWVASFPCEMFGQIDSIEIETIEISATKKVRYNNIGGNNQSWSEKHLQQLPSNNLAELLSNETSIFVKNYGPGSLSTSSVRGGSASHTLVLWNGIPLQSPMLGLLDLSLLPLNAVENISFQTGGNSALWGSGAIGGVLSMDNQADYNNTLSISNFAKVGSFGQLTEQLKFGIGNKNFQSQTKIFHQQAQNDFPFLIAPNFPEKTQTNAAFSEQNILQDFYWKKNSNNQFALHFWQQVSNKQIPPTIVQNNSVAEQDDKATRLTLDYKKIEGSFMASAKIGFINEHNNYFDEAQLLEARNHFRRWIGEVETQLAIDHRQKVLTGLTYSYTQAWSDGYEGSPNEFRSAAFMSYLFEDKKLQSQASLRAEKVDKKYGPLVPSLGLNYKAFPSLQIKFKTSRNYRSPTLNDKFWHPVGNENLQPERGWSNEATILFSKNNTNTNFNFSTTGYTRTINNWILWSRLQGQTFWSPNNIAKVWSRGLEQRLSLNHQRKNWKFKWSGSYNLTRSTNLISMELPKIEKGEQLRYTPVHQGLMQFSIGQNKWNWTYRQQLVSQSEGFNESLPSYSVGSMNFNYFFEKNKWKSQAFLAINNIWNTSYVVVERRPMPMRNFQFGLNITFLKSKK